MPLCRAIRVTHQSLWPGIPLASHLSPHALLPRARRTPFLSYASYRASQTRQQNEIGDVISGVGSVTSWRRESGGGNGGRRRRKYRKRLLARGARARCGAPLRATRRARAARWRRFHSGISSLSARRSSLGALNAPLARIAISSRHGIKAWLKKIMWRRRNWRI